MRLNGARCSCRCPHREQRWKHGWNTRKHGCPHRSREKLGTTVPRRPRMAENMALPKNSCRGVSSLIDKVYAVLAPLWGAMFAAGPGGCLTACSVLLFYSRAAGIGEAGVPCNCRSRSKRNCAACRFSRSLHLETEEPHFLSPIKRCSLSQEWAGENPAKTGVVLFGQICSIGSRIAPAPLGVGG